MGLFNRHKEEDFGALEERRDRLVLEEEIATRGATVAEKQAVISQLKREYGHDWKSQLGLKGKLDVQTLKTFLGGANKGLKQTSASYGSSSGRIDVGTGGGGSGRISVLPGKVVKA